MFFILAKILWFLLQPSSLMLAMRDRWRNARLHDVAAAGARFSVGRGRGSADLRVVAVGRRADPAARTEVPRVESTGPALPSQASSCWVVRRTITPWIHRNWRGSTRPRSDTPEAVILARHLPSASLVFSGGSGAVLTIEPPEAETAGRLFEALGIAKDTDHAGNKVARHLRERALYGASARPAPRTALAARHVGLAHAACHGLLSPRKVHGGGLAGGLSRAAPT